MNNGAPVPNRVVVLTEILASGPTTRVAVSEATGLSGATVSRAVDALLRQDLVRESAALPPSGRGRPAMLLEGVGERALACGVDLGAANTRFVVSDLLARTLVVRRTPTPAGLGPDRLGRWIAEETAVTAGQRWGAVAAVGLGLPGAVHPDDRTVSDAPNLPVVEDRRFLLALDAAVTVPVVLDNDANFAMLGEQRFGAARGASAAVMFTIGAGLGAGVVLGGRLLRGRRGLVGEFGHLPVGPLGTPLESIVTGPGILGAAAELGLRLSSPAELFGATHAASELRHRVEDALVLMLTAATVSYEPEVIVLGGGIATSLTPGLPHLAERLADTVRHAPSLVPAALGDLSGAYGAAVAALRSIYRGMAVPEEELSRLPSATALTRFPVPA